MKKKEINYEQEDDFWKLFESLSQDKMETINLTEVEKTLLENKTQINSKDKHGNTLLHYATIKGNRELVKLILNLGANCEEEGNNKFTPLFIAVANGHQEIVQDFLNYSQKKKELVNKKSVLGNAPLHLAAERNDIKLLKLLIENGANVKELNDAN